ncbi:YchJ family metal-binding protein [Zobellia galactanivorans]|uniref:YchJ-like middle NTF2-like domain-containing protein n=1 Tax=Zobellia galactanivorans (strain DSM 12802 / CCUG 47099 / CIP 106680 / NCIMB 13871 / Dsij) TaxID=63186 RepID=G0L7R6_ZOBGA|nr:MULTISPECIES: YchJ family metal-binding protein [Zobellia]MBU3025076.1 Sec-C motif domain protein [Zobellia galactanivorans]MDO6808624.1 YchJ family metal-binding protein [Zobellia galactanivorans]OWW25606.1 Sec-C motif domain protein [Zobellia sp. OII3]CAZ98229.1 Conserved hypothetical protein [Zobellia galactanivorans]
MPCPCNPQVNYSDCCKKAHTDIRSVATAEALMRSRYSAFVLGDIDYLQKSHHSTTRPNKIEKRRIKTWAKAVNWLKLEVLYTSEGSETDSSGTVEFKAYYMENGQMGVIYEKSNFSKENGHWVYVDGVHRNL